MTDQTCEDLYNNTQPEFRTLFDFLPWKNGSIEMKFIYFGCFTKDNGNSEDVREVALGEDFFYCSKYFDKSNTTQG